MNGDKRVLGTTTNYGSSFNSGDLLEIHVDIENEWIEFFKNRESQGRITLNTFGKPLFFAVSYANQNEYWEIVSNE